MSDIPVLCAQCLGSNEHVKMIRQPLGEQCKLCTRPFTVFRWNLAGEHRQLKKTIFCQTCSQARNCCQSCMVDVEYGIPLDIRDAALKMAGVVNPHAAEDSSRNAEVRAIKADKLENQMNADTKSQDKDMDKKQKAKVILETLAAKLSSNTTVRPKQRELEISSKELAKTISKLPFGGTSDCPEDATIKSFFVFGFSPQTPQYILTDFFGKFGTLTQVKIVHQARCGYVSFSKRTAAEECAEFLRRNDLSKNAKTAALIVLESETVRVSWGAPRSIGNNREEETKIAVVVNKVMKQLADKDASGKTCGRRKEQGPKVAAKEKTGGTTKENPKKQYKSIANDFEA